MRALPSLGILLLACLTASPALADAVTYEGTLGKAPIVVELSAPLESASGRLVGRYFYEAKGIDIPLQPRKVTAGKADLAEERPCSPKLCHTTEDGKPGGPAPLGGRWHLEAGADGAVTGSWSDSGKSLPISLSRVGTRPLPGDFDGTTAGLADIVVSKLTTGDTALSDKTSPYDYLKLAKMEQPAGPPTVWAGGSFINTVDPRTKFAFPRISSLAGGADPKPVNAALEQAHWRLSLDALACEAEAYQGFGWTEFTADAVGTLGDYDSESIEVTALTPTVMSYRDTGAPFCGGAHPDNHRDYTTLDVKTGEALDISLLVKDWIAVDPGTDKPVDPAEARGNPGAYTWGPDQKLLDFVMAHRPKLDDADLEDACGGADTIRSNLTISFAEGDRIRFSLTGVPNVIAVCNDDLFDLPLSEVKPFLTPTAAQYFAALKG